MVTSLRVRMGLLFLAFFSLSAISVAATFWAIDAQKKDALVINLAGRQRMLIQQMSKDALRIDKDREEAHVLALQEAARTFDRTLWAFFDGGSAPYLPGRTVTVPATRQSEILAGLHRVHRTWDTFYSHLEVITAADPESPDFRTAIQTVDHLSPDLVQQADDVVRMYEAASAQKIARLRWIQVAFSASALVLLAAGSLVIQKSVVSPLRVLGSAAERIGRGDLSAPVVATGPREIERLAHSFDTMRTQLRTSQEELTAWTEELEARVAQRTRELAALQEVSREISSRLEIQDVLRSVTDKARMLLDGEVAVLCFLDETGLALNLGAVSGPQEAASKTLTSARRALAEQVLAGEGALPCGADECEGACGILAAPFWASHLAAPMRMGERIIGALCVGSSKAGTFSGEAAGLLTELANSAAIALENARLYEQAEHMATLEERQRIAAEMHDGLAQMLSYLGLKAEQVVDLVEAGQGEVVVEELHRLREAIAQASQEVRRSITNLQEGPQPRQALQDRLAVVVGEFAGEGGPPVELAMGFQTPLLLLPDESEHVLRVVREALLNARRHAQAGQVVVRLERRGDEVRVSVQDDGQGFDPQTPTVDGSSHFGLRIMRARAARIGGQLAVHPAPGHGTRVSLSWPVDNEQRITNDE